MYLLLDELSGLVVEYGPQAVPVCGSLRMQTEVKSDIDGGQLIPKLLFILHPARGIQTDTDT